MASKRYAILIASSKFPEELRCPEHDVDALLRSSEFGQFTETFVFSNKPSHEVLEKIETVLHDAGREDLVLIYFSGHGKLKVLGFTSIPIERIKSFFDAASTRKNILILTAATAARQARSLSKAGWMTSFSSCRKEKAPSS